MKTKLLRIVLCAFLNIQAAQTDTNRKQLIIQQLRKATEDTHSYSPTARGDASKALNYLFSISTTPLPEPDDATLRALKKYGFASKRGRVYPEARDPRHHVLFDIFAGYIFYRY